MIALAGDQTSFRSLGELRAAHMQLLSQSDGIEPDDKLLNRIEMFVQAACATGAVLENAADRRSAQSILDYWSTVLYRARRVSTAAMLVDFDPLQVASRPLTDADRPYPGVRPFKSDEAAHFFGRELLVTELATRLRTERVLAITGMPMSGKTSLVVAGLLPALRDGRIRDSAAWQYLGPVVPGPTPLDGLAGCLAQLKFPTGSAPVGHDAIADGMASSSAFLRQLVRTAVSPCLLIVDQLEALFTSAADGNSDAQAVLDNLVELARDGSSNCRLIVIARTDQAPSGAAAETLLDPAVTVQVPTFGAREMRDAIVQPAELVGLRYEDGIVADLVAALIAVPAHLPLLQLVLCDLWKLRDANASRVQWSTYRAFLNDPVRRRANPASVLQRAADGVYTSLTTEADRDRARRIFLSLVEADTNWELRFARVRQASLSDGPHEARPTATVLQRFAQVGVVRVTPDGDDTNPNVELTHESLPRYWSVLDGWLHARMDALLEYLVVKAAAEDWDRHRRPTGALWTGSRLKAAREFETSRNAGVRAFIQASAHREHILFLQRLAAFVGGALLVLLVLVQLGVLALQQADAAHAATSRELAAQSEVETDRHLDLALLLGMYARHIAPTSQARGVLLSNLESNPYLSEILSDPLHPRALALSPDSHWLAVIHEDGSIDVWDTRTRGQPTHIEDGRTPYPITLAFNSDSSQLVVVRPAADALEIWQVATGERLDAGAQPRGDFTTTSTAISSNGTLALAGPQAVQLRGPQPDSSFISIPLAATNANARAVAFTPDGGIVAIAGCRTDTPRCSGGIVQLFDVTSRELLVQLPMATPVVSLDVGRSDEFPLMVAAGASDGASAIWGFDDPSGAPNSHHVVAQTPAGSWLPLLLGLTGDSHQMLMGRCLLNLQSTCDDADIQLWDTQANPAVALQRPVASHMQSSQSIAFAHAGLMVAIANRETISVFDLSNRMPSVTRRPAYASLRDVQARSPAQAIVAGIKCDGPSVANCPQGVALFDSQDASQMGSLLSGERHTGSVTSLAFNATGTLLASGGDDGILMWDVAQGTQHGNRLTPGPVVRGLAFGTHNGHELLAAADDDRNVTLWEASTGQRASIVQPEAADAGLRSLAFSPDGQLLAAGTVDGRILVWNVDKHDLAAPPFIGQVGQVRLLGFTTYAGMRLLASVDQENRITVWDVDAARPLAFPPNHGDDLVTGVDFLTDAASGRLVLVTHYVQTDESWMLQLDVDEGRLSDRVCNIVWRNLSSAEQERYTQQQLPFPSSLLESWLTITNRSCPELGPHPAS